MTWLADAFWDLVYGGVCLGCQTPGRQLCRACANDLPRDPVVVWPTPCPVGLATPYATGGYAGLLRDLVVAHKEHQAHSLTPVLGDLLARSVAAGVSADVSVTLVPVPSRPSATRARGHNPTLALTRAAAGVLGRAGADCRVVQLLRTGRGVRDQAGLTSIERAENLAGALVRRGAMVSALARSSPTTQVVVCDDVITTGATAREAQRVLEAIGIGVTSVAAVAATRRRAVDVRFVRGC